MQSLNLTQRTALSSETVSEEWCAARVFCPLNSEWTWVAFRDAEEAEAAGGVDIVTVPVVRPAILFGSDVGSDIRRAVATHAAAHN